MTRSSGDFDIREKSNADASSCALLSPIRNRLNILQLQHYRVHQSLGFMSRIGLIYAHLDKYILVSVFNFLKSPLRASWLRLSMTPGGGTLAKIVLSRHLAFCY